jgi:hypothetical protein
MRSVLHHSIIDEVIVRIKFAEAIEGGRISERHLIGPHRPQFAIAQ